MTDTPKPPEIVRPDAQARAFLRSDLRDARFYNLHKAEIEDAARNGRIIDDLDDWKVAPKKGGTK